MSYCLLTSDFFNNKKNISLIICLYSFPTESKVFHPVFALEFSCQPVLSVHLPLECTPSPPIGRFLLDPAHG